MAKKEESGPLNKAHLERLNKVLESCAQTRELCSKCKACYIDVDKEIEENEEQAAIAAQLKAQFFPLAK